MLDSTRVERSVVLASIALIAGIALSGPIALCVVQLVQPQPPWCGAAQFASAYHAIQLLPYLAGFLLVGGCVALVASLWPLAAREHAVRANIALVLAAAFAALILLNYVLQTTVVPSLVRPYQHDHAPLIAVLSMSNPRSLAWALEMWGYGAFGVATWAIACAFRTTTFERIVAATYVANGVISIAAALATMVAPGWAISASGLVSFAVWNVLMVVMAVLTIIAMRRRPHDPTRATPTTA